MGFASLKEAFQAFEGQRVLVIGDVMIDSYLWGGVSRISPEAPVPVVNVKSREKRLGGAANVALNLKAMGAEAILCGVVGEEASLPTFLDLMGEADLNIEGILSVDDRPTTIKHRIIAGSQHLLRIDEESDGPVGELATTQLLARIEKLLPTCSVVIFEDYDKGVITPALIEAVVKMSREKGIPTVVDPKKRNFLEYKGVTLFKPNLKELREGLKIDASLRELGDLQGAVGILHQHLKADSYLVTRSELGVFFLDKGEEVSLPAHKREIADVSGAGDTVISIAALCCALGLSAPLVAALSNLAGGLVCESVGVVPIDKAKLLAEAERLGLTL